MNQSELHKFREMEAQYSFFCFQPSTLKSDVKGYLTSYINSAIDDCRKKLVMKRPEDQVDPALAAMRESYLSSAQAYGPLIDAYIDNTFRVPTRKPEDNSVAKIEKLEHEAESLINKLFSLNRYKQKLLLAEQQLSTLPPTDALAFSVEELNQEYSHHQRKLETLSNITTNCRRNQDLEEAITNMSICE